MATILLDMMILPGGNNTTSDDIYCQVAKRQLDTYGSPAADPQIDTYGSPSAQACSLQVGTVSHEEERDC